MASISYDFNIHHHHHVFLPEIMQNTRLIPNPSINFEFTIKSVLVSVRPEIIGGGLQYFRGQHIHTEQETLGFSLIILKDEILLHQIQTPRFCRLGIDTASARYRKFIRSIIVRGLGIPAWIFNGGNDRNVLSLRSEVYAFREEYDYDDAIPMGSGKYGMVPAKESSVKEVLKRVKVEARDEKEDCTICLEELKVGFAASRMPCSLTFHVGCIDKWQKQSHYCPICRFEIPTN